MAATSNNESVHTEDFTVTVVNLAKARKECSKAGKVYQVIAGDLVRFECEKNQEAVGRLFYFYSFCYISGGVGVKIVKKSNNVVLGNTVMY